MVCGQHPLRRKQCSGAQTDWKVLEAAFCCGVFHDCDSVTSLHLSLLRNPHWELSDWSWGRQSSEFTGASKHQQKNCRFNGRKDSGWLQGTLPTTPMSRKIHLTYLQHQVHDNAFASQLFCTFWMKKCCTPPCICFSLKTMQYDPAWAEIQYCLTKRRRHLYQIFNELLLRLYQTPLIKSLMWSQNVRYSVPFNQDKNLLLHSIQHIKYIEIAPIPRF